MTEVRYLEDVANVKAGEVVEQPKSTAEWLVLRGLAEVVEKAPARKPGRPRKAVATEES